MGIKRGKAVKNCLKLGENFEFEQIDRFLRAEGANHERITSESLTSLFFKERRERFAHNCSLQKSNESDLLIVALFFKKLQERKAHGRSFLKNYKSEWLMVAL